MPTSIVTLSKRSRANMIWPQPRLASRTSPVSKAPQAFRTRDVSALLVVTPTSEKHLSLLRGIFAGAPQRRPQLVPIEFADAIASVEQAYESYELPKGTVRGSPPIPDEDLTTLRVPYYLVADKNVSETAIAELTKVIMEARRDLLTEHPLLAQISAPSTDKDAYIPIHKGAAAFYEDTQQNSWINTATGFLFQWRSVYSRPFSPGRANSSASASTALQARWSPFMRWRIPYGMCAAKPISMPSRRRWITSSERSCSARVQARLRAAETAALSLTAQRLDHLIQQRRARLAVADRRAQHEPPPEQRVGGE